MTYHIIIRVKLGGKKLKKIVIAFFLVIIMLMVPFTTIAKTENTCYINKISPIYYEIPEFYITSQQRQILENFIETNFEGEEKVDAYEVFNTIISSDNEIDIIELANAVYEYGVQQIPAEQLNNAQTIDDLNTLINSYWKATSILENLVDEIVQLIKDRLGWLYIFLTDGIALILEGVELIVDIFNNFFVIALSFVTAINDMIFVPGFFRDLLTELFSLNFEEVDNMITTLTESFIGEVVTILNSLLDLIQNPVLSDYLSRLIDFLEWVEAEPWTEPILVTGSVKLNLFSLSGALITCRGQTTTTDDEGKFSFEVDAAPDDSSFPPGKYYGMHSCVITVSRDGKILKETIPVLSYVFSGGKINWQFFIIKSRSKEINYGQLLFEKMSAFWEKIYNLFPNIFNNFRYFDISYI